MKRALALIATISACFGDGPVPTPPTGATVLFQVDREPAIECGTAEFIGDVAIGATYGYAVTFLWMPPSDNNCDGGGPQSSEPPVYRFSKNGDGQPEKIGLAGRTSGNENARLTASGDDVVWAFDNANTPMSAILVGSNSVSAMLPYSGSSFTPVAAVSDATAYYIVGSTFTGGYDTPVTNPQFPCCPNTGGGGSELQSLMWKLPKGAATGAPFAFPPVDFYKSGIKTGLATNTNWLFYFQQTDTLSTTPITVQAMKKDLAAEPWELAVVDRENDLVPGGIAANDGYAFWSVRPFYLNWPLPAPRCKIYKYQAGADMAALLWETNEFSCVDLVADDEHVYFSIIHIDDNSDSHQSSPYGMQGWGIGRVHIETGALETLDHGIRGEFSGPRRIYLDGTAMYVVDPFTIARIETSALAGRNDF